MRALSTLALLVSLGFGYDYSHCLKYYDAASTKLDLGYAISLKNGKAQNHLYYGTTPPHGVKILKSDPFIGLYLIAAPRTKQSYDLLPLDSRTLKDSNLALISHQSAQRGKILARQSGFLNYGRFSAPTQPNGVLGNICYQIYGIGTPSGFIEKRYIDRFLAQKSPYYGDLGIRFSGKRAVVEFIDPFMPSNPFAPGDDILSINGKKIASASELEWVMSNLKKDSLAQVSLRRGGKILTLKVRVYQRYGGFLLQETFLERFGIVLSDDMVIERIDPALAGRFSPLRVGDKIEWINKEPIITESTPTPKARFDRLKALLAKTPFDERFDGKMQLLIVRDNLEIFVKL